MSSQFARFFKKNKEVKKNTFYAPTESLTDENGEALKFEIKPLTTKEHDRIRSECTRDVPIPGKNGMYRPKTDSIKYGLKIVAESIVVPDLYDQELQDSYGVTTPEDLIQEMVDSPGEFIEFQSFIQEFNGFSDDDLDKKREEAKK